MTTDQSGAGRPEDQGQRKAKHSAFALLKDDEDRDLLRLWRENLTLQDQRYDSKVLLKLVVLAMTDEQTRSRLINDTEDFLREVRSNVDLDLPEGTSLRFFENTQDTLNVVLPPPAGGMRYTRSGQLTYRSPELRDALRSRTSSTEGLRWYFDDFDIGDHIAPYGYWDSWDVGDWGWRDYA
jgi:hypothetical protein